ncbi:MAG: hypothetical protein K6E46_05520 [Lachnospiraceae bacterium]|nr:hypothetical protein [Lachnospiraceae bacterium]
MDMIEINHLWAEGSEKEWKEALGKYYNMPQVMNISDLDREIDEAHNNLGGIRKMSGEAFYDFLHDKYFVWKYTAPNRLATTRMALEKQDKNELAKIKNELFDIHDNIPDEIELLLKTVMQIKGLGTVGASGLLSILFPDEYCSVDQYSLESLCEIKSFSDETKRILKAIKPNSIKYKEGAFIEMILRDKAGELNKKFNTSEWTPRKMDMILWAYR